MELRRRWRFKAKGAPKDLKVFGLADLPEDLARPFTEKDGTRGRLVYVEPVEGKDEDDLQRESNARAQNEPIATETPTPGSVSEAADPRRGTSPMRLALRRAALTARARELLDSDLSVVAVQPAAPTRVPAPSARALSQVPAFSVSTTATSC